MPVIEFSGFRWTVKESRTRVGPGPNVFSAANVATDGRSLRLCVAGSGTQWSCAEVIGHGEFAYGTYTWAVDSDVTRLDRNTVLGMFTWSDRPDYAHREIDIEFARWGGAHPIGSGVFTVQAGGGGNDSRSALTGSEQSLHTMTWEPGEVSFSSSDGSAPITWSYTGRDVPPPGGGVAPRIICGCTKETHRQLHRASRSAASVIGPRHELH